MLPSVSFRLFMSLNSREDEARKRLLEKQKKMEKPDEEASPADFGFQASMASVDDESKAVDCWAANRKAIETTRTGNYDAYIPECEQDGRYKSIQCYKVRKWSLSCHFPEF